MFPRRPRHAFVFALVAAIAAYGQAKEAGPGPQNSGTFVLHKFAQAIGKETYSIETKGDVYALKSHFLFTDRGSAVPLETTFTARVADRAPLTYEAKGRASRQSAMDDVVTCKDASISVTRGGKTSLIAPAGPWFITDSYSPVAMQEQMMRWWMLHGKPPEFTVYPTAAKVHIKPAETLHIQGSAAYGYTVGGLIWGQEALWIDDAQNLVALVSTDAEFDHFEAIREPFESSLGIFIASAVQANLQELARLSAGGRVSAARTLVIRGATLEDSTGAPPVEDSAILIEDGVIVAVGPRAAAYAFLRAPRFLTLQENSCRGHVHPRR